MACFTGKHISQDTFNEVVKENIDEFDMSPDDALTEAVTQFKNQGVDLSSIDTTGGMEREDIDNAIDIILEYDRKFPADSTKSVTDSNFIVINAFETLTLLTSPAHSLFKRNIMIVMKSVWSVIMRMISIQTSSDILLAVLAFITNICNTDESIKDSFLSGGNERCCRLLSSTIGHLSSSPSLSLSSLIATLTLIRVVITKNERNKSAVMDLGIGSLLISLSQLNSSSYNISVTQWNSVLAETFLMIKQLCLHDDMRREMSCAYDNGRYFMSMPCVMEAIMKAALQFQTYPDLAAAAMSTTKQLVLSEEAVKIVAEYGGLELPSLVLNDSESSILLVRAVAGLMRNLCADDDRKHRLVNDGTMTLLVRAMMKDEYLSDGSFIEHAVATLAAMSLRSPANAVKIIEASGIHALIRGMKKHPHRDPLQRHACLAVRNIAARSPELRGVMLDAGIESVLRAAGRLQGAVDHAYAALRDLGVDVQYVKVSGEGVVQPVYEEFGANKNLNFSPTFDAVDDLDARIMKEGKPPLV